MSHHRAARGLSDHPTRYRFVGRWVWFGATVAVAYLAIGILNASHLPDRGTPNVIARLQ